MNSLTWKLYSKMFVQTDGKMPAFDKLDNTSLIVNPIVDTILETLLSEHKIDLEQIEINALLKIFKKTTPSIANQFSADAISYYFSHPQVLAALQGGRTTLFPNYRTLPDIDYDLLIPVFEKDY
jgi:hypothetical protein